MNWIKQELLLHCCNTVDLERQQFEAMLLAHLARVAQNLLGFCLALKNNNKNILRLFVIRRVE